MTTIRSRLMGNRMVVLSLVFVSAFVTPTLWPQNAPGESHVAARAQSLIREGDLEGALEVYRQGAREPGAAPEIQQKFMLLRRTLQMRAALATEEDPERWWKIGETLRNAYYSFRLYDDLLALASQMHQRRPTPGSATVMADALLLLQHNAEAEKVLARVGIANLSPQGRVLWGLALGRQGQVDHARNLLASLETGEGPSPRLLCDLARLKVLCGDIEGGMTTLVTALQRSSPKGVAGFREFIRTAPEFSGLPESSGFDQVLQTAPGADESACSGGSSCGSCPEKEACPSGKQE